MDLVYTGDYYIALIDLLGVKKLIKKDKGDAHLNIIKNIYNSWPRIMKDRYFKDFKIRFFSDNVVIALPVESNMTADKLLEVVGWICTQFLLCGYKPRGGICKGKFYIDDLFIWGSGLVDAYFLESKVAINPRIVVSKEIKQSVSVHLANQLLFEDGGDCCLHYLKSFGGNRDVWIADIDKVLGWLIPEYESYCSKKELSDDEEKVKNKLKWLLDYVNMSKEYWMQFSPVS